MLHFKFGFKFLKMRRGGEHRRGEGFRDLLRNKMGS